MLLRSTGTAWQRSGDVNEWPFFILVVSLLLWSSQLSFFSFSKLLSRCRTCHLQWRKKVFGCLMNLRCAALFGKNRSQVSNCFCFVFFKFTYFSRILHVHWAVQLFWAGWRPSLRIQSRTIEFSLAVALLAINGKIILFCLCASDAAEPIGRTKQLWKIIGIKFWGCLETAFHYCLLHMRMEPSWFERTKQNKTVNISCWSAWFYDELNSTKAQSQLKKTEVFGEPFPCC